MTSKHTPGPWEREIARLIREGRTDSEIIAAHHVGWRLRAAEYVRWIRAAIVKAEGRS